jgi:hypothetical protein
MVTPSSEEDPERLEWEYPCLVVNDSGGEEILWGATFRILMTFMERTFELGAEQINPARRVLKELSPHYFSGKERGRG